MDKAVKIDAVVGVGMFAGKVDLTNYNTTQAEVTAITGKFKSLIAVLPSATEDGYVLAWDNTASSFVAYEAGADGAALDECANDTDCGVAHFIAIGLI